MYNIYMNKYIVITIILCIIALCIYIPIPKKRHNLPSCHLMNNHQIRDLTLNKEIAKRKLSSVGAPVARSIYLKYIDINRMTRTVLRQHIEQMMKDNQLNFPVVMKPTEGECGIGIQTSILWIDQLMESIYEYKTNGRYKMDLLIERQHDGKVYRILYVNKKLVGIIERDTPIVEGDGIHTIKQLVGKLNENIVPELRTVINNYFIGIRGYTPQSVLEKGKILSVTNKLDFTGCRQKNIPVDQIHPVNKKMFDELFNKLDINCVGVDYISTDITKPYYETDGIVLELNSRPDRIIHLKIDPLFEYSYMKELKELRSSEIKLNR